MYKVVNYNWFDKEIEEKIFNGCKYSNIFEIKKYKYSDYFYFYEF